MTTPTDTTTAPARRIILSRPALVYRADPTHSHGFTIVEVPKGDYPAGVDAVGETLWVTLKNVKGMESDIIGMRKDRWKRMECATLVGFDESGESSPVESVADSPPAAAGRPDNAVTECARRVGLVGIEFDEPTAAAWERFQADSSRPGSRPEPKAIPEVDPSSLGLRQAPDRLCGHPLAVSGVVVPGAEGEGETDTPGHLILPQCRGEWCTLCGSQAHHKVGEEIFDNEPHQTIDGITFKAPRHNLTAYLCCPCFRRVMGGTGTPWCLPRHMPAPDPSIPALQRAFSAEVRADVDRVREIVEERARTTGEKIGGTTA